MNISSRIIYLTHDLLVIEIYLPNKNRSNNFQKISNIFFP